MTNRVYFPGLNGIRFLAAVSVMYYHVEQIKTWFGISRGGFFLPKLFLEGNDAVTLFFVVSGFLITYLLLVEHKRSGEISIKSFYVRRILRIWPLYYFLLLLGFIGLPLLEGILGFQGHYPLYSRGTETITTLFVLYTFLLPHIGIYFSLVTTGISQLWTIGIEENFYLVWPVLMRKFIKKVPLLLMGLIGIKLLLIVIYNQFIVSNPQLPLWFKQVIAIINFIRIENMAVGGVGAYLIFRQPKWLFKIIFHPLVEKLILILMVGNIFYFNGVTNVWINEGLSVLYILFILNVSCNPRSTLKLENHFFNTFGRVAYGIYMYHVLVIYLLLMLFHYLNFTDNGTFYNIVLYSLVTVCTLGIALLSYTYFEERFLRLRTRFITVESGAAPLEKSSRPQSIESDFPLPSPQQTIVLPPSE